MSGEEDEKELELKDLIVQTLEANGLLSKIKAQLRASVFMALDENDKDSNKNNDFKNSKVKKLLQTNEGRLGASLIRDFLECCNLDYTISVLDPELNSNIFWDKREKLCKTLNVNEDDSNIDYPVLTEFLKDQQSKKKQSNDELPSNVIDSIRYKFDKFDTSKKGSLDKDKVKGLFMNFFPNFSKSVIERYVLDEIENNDLKSGANFDDVLFIYKKFYKFCCNVSNHTNITSNSGSYGPNDGFISSNNIRNNMLSNKTKSIHDQSGDDDDDSVSSNSSSAFKRSEKNDEKQGNTIGQSSLGDLPPLNNTGNFQNKFFSSTSNSKDLGKKIKDEDDYEDDFVNNGTPRTPKSDRKYKNRSALGSDEEIEDNLSYVDESSKVDEITIDRSISTVQGNNDADYIEDLSI